MNKKILVIDDEQDIRFLTSGILEDEGYLTEEAANSTDALNIVASKHPDLVLLDIWLEKSELDGLGILDVLKSKYPNIPVLMMSGHGNIEVAVDAIKRGAYDFIEKPFTTERLLFLVARALEVSHLRRENEELKKTSQIITSIDGSSPAIKQIKSYVQKIATTESRVLITGPSGSGKEVVARNIHGLSNRTNYPFVVANCDATDAQSFERELKGYEDDSNNVEVGLLEQAHGGTLLLDEISELSDEAQGKLIKVLQNSSFSRINGNSSLSVNVRFLATSKKDLKKLVDDKLFREDLYYRIAVMHIDMPPLKERRADIIDLANMFLSNKLNTSSGDEPKFSEEALAILQSFDWPGNVRELYNIVERVAIMGSNNGVFDKETIPEEIKNTDRIKKVTQTSKELIAMPIKLAREEFERRYMIAQLIRFDGNISKTAAFIGMERTALHRKIKLLNIDTENLDQQQEML